MARIRGANNFHLADVESNTEEEYKAGKPEKTERIIGINIDTKEDSETLYSDDEVEEDVYGTPEVTGKVELNYLSNETKVKIFGGFIDANGVYFPEEDGSPKVHKALGFRAPTGGGKTKNVWYYDAIFEKPSTKAETSEGKPKTSTIELNFKCYKNKKLGKHYCDLDTNTKTANTELAKKWFESVYCEPVEKVILAEGSLGTAGDKSITGLTAGKIYKVTCGEVIKYSNAIGTLVDEGSKAALGSGVTSITGLTNGQTYKVEEYTEG